MQGRATTTAYFYLSPAILVMLLTGVVPMLFILFYSVHDTFAGNSFVFIGLDWFRQVLSDPDFHWALLRSLGFCALVLAVELPLGILIASRMPREGWPSSVLLVIMAVPLLMPYIVVGYLWKVMTLPKAGLLSEALTSIGIGLDLNNPVVVWATLLVMDAWHWTGLVVLLCFAALKTIPIDYYRAAQIDGASRWRIFRYVELPKLKLVLLIAALIRMIDSFIIYTEAYVITRGGPGVTTTFLSHELVQTGLIQFDLGEAAAMAVIYFAIVCGASWLFFRVIVPRKSHAH